MPRTGERCLEAGVYERDKPGHEPITLKEGETFPPCQDCGQPVDWRLVRPAG